jgi:GntR family transcriptional regulator
MLMLQPGPIPLYYQLQRDLLERIRNGEFRPDEPLPTEERLCSDYGISRITVRRALDALLHDGVIARRRGVGTFVSQSDQPLKSVRLAGSLEDLLGAPEFSYTLLARSRVQPPAPVRQALALADTARAVLLETVNYSSGEPFGYSEIYLPEEVGVLIQAADVTGEIPMLRVVEHHLGQRVARAEQTIEPALAGRTAATHLGIKASKPVLRAARTYFTEAGRAVETVIALYHPERYRFSVHLSPRRPG